MKEQIKRSEVPMKISHIQFGMFSSQEITKMSSLHVCTRELYQMPERKPSPFGVLDRRLGTSDKMSTCETCKAKMADCAGHYGHITLELPVFHIGYFRPIVVILQNICKVGILCCRDLCVCMYLLTFVNFIAFVCLIFGIDD